MEINSVDQFYNSFSLHILQALKAKQRLREIIASSINSSANNNDSSGDLCSVLQGLGAADGGVEKNTVLLDGIIDLLFSGAETVTSAGFSLAHQLSKRPDVVEKIRKEIEQQGLLHSEETICPADLQKMTYVNAVVKETLRMLPPVGGAYRTVLETFDLDVSSYIFLLFFFTPTEGCIYSIYFLFLYCIADIRE